MTEVSGMDVIARDLENAAELLSDIGTGDYVNGPTADAMQEAASDVRRIAADHRGAVSENERMREIAQEAFRSLLMGRVVEATEYLRTFPRPSQGGR